MRLLLFLFIFLQVDQSLFARSIFHGKANDGIVYYLILIGIALFLLFLVRFFSAGIVPKKKGFISINPEHPSKFVEYEEKKEKSFEQVVKELANQKLNIYSNLSKMHLSKKGGYMFLEDKNIKISFLINRRRSRNSYLKDGDIIDIGDLTMMVIDPSADEKNLANEKAKKHLKNSRANGRLLKNTSALFPLDSRRKTFFLTKNLSFIGRSDENNLIIKVMGVSLRHAKIQRISGKHKIIDLTSEGGTFVNGRRINEKYLSDKDLISFESVQYRFSETGKPV